MDSDLKKLVFDPTTDKTPLYEVLNEWLKSQGQHAQVKEDCDLSAAFETGDASEDLSPTMEDLVMGAELHQRQKITFTYRNIYNKDSKFIEVATTLDSEGCDCLLLELVATHIDFAGEVPLIMTSYIEDAAQQNRKLTCFNTPCSFNVEGTERLGQAVTMLHPTPQIIQLYKTPEDFVETLETQLQVGWPTSDCWDRGIVEFPIANDGVESPFLQVSAKAPLAPQIHLLADTIKEQMHWDMDNDVNHTFNNKGEVVSYKVPAVVVAQVVKYVASMEKSINYVYKHGDRLVWRVERADGQPFNEGPWDHTPLSLATGVVQPDSVTLTVCMEVTFARLPRV